MSSGDPQEPRYAKTVQLFSALANPLRIAIVHCLLEKPHTVSELHECLDISQPLASHHLRILLQAHVISKHPEGRKTYYSLEDEHIVHVVRDIHEHTKE